MFDLDELHLVLVGDPVEHRGDRVARATPLGPEVDDHLAVGLRGPRCSKVVARCFVAIEFLSSVDCTRVSNAAAEAILPARVRIESMFTPLPDKPGSSARSSWRSSSVWEREGTFEQLRERNRGGPKWSFIDGPVTANKTLARPHRLGPDAEGRLPALQGAARLRPALPERLRLPGALDRGRRRARARPQLEARDRGVRPRGVRRASAARSSSGRREELTRGSKRLGQWMDWGNDYFTFSDTNIEYIWRFLKIVHERGWLYIGHRSTEWCPRCGTSLSQHELTQSGVYQDRADPSLYRPLPAARPAGRVGRRLDDDAVDAAGERRRRRQSRRPSTGGARTASGSRSRATPTSTFVERVHGLGARRLALPRAVRRPRAGRRRSSTASIPWDEVSLDEGTGIVHIAPGCGGEDFELAQGARPAGADAGRRGRPLLRRLRLAARALDGRGRRPDHRRPRRDGLPRRGRACTSTATRTAGAATRR